MSADSKPKTIAEAVPAGKASSAKAKRGTDKAAKPASAKKSKPRKGTRAKGASKGKGKRPAEQRSGDSEKRLRPGELDGIVLADLRKREDEWPLTAGAIGKSVDRSAGAISNCLSRLEQAKKVRLAKAKPRSYDLQGL